MVVEVVDVEVEEVAGEVDPVVVVAGFLEVSAGRPGFSSGIMPCHMRKCHENMHAVDVDEAVGEAEGFELLDLDSHLILAPDQFQKQTYWAALAC